MKKALIFGVTGQDGTYLADFLLKKGYQVYGTYRRTSHKCFERLELFNIFNDVEKVSADVTDPISINSIVKKIKPDEIYNLAAQSFVGISFEQPLLTSNVTGLGALHVLEAVKEYSPDSRLYQASSSEMFGNSDEIKTENSRMFPLSPYGCAKVFAHKTAQLYRQSYNLFVCCGILFNHESPHRGLEFVTRKITSAIASIKAKKQKKLFLGNIKAKRDWGFAGDYVEAMWMMLQKDKPDDYIIATGISHSVENFLTNAFDYAGLGDWKNYVEIDQKFIRPVDIDNLIGDPSKAKKELGWKNKTAYEELVKVMVDSDIDLINNS